MGNKQDNRDRWAHFGPEEIATIRKDLAAIMQQIDSFADLVKVSDFTEELIVDGGACVFDAQELLVRWLRRTQEQFDLQMVKKARGVDNGKVVAKPKKRRVVD